MLSVSSTKSSQVCPRCAQPFTCQASAINNCQCKAIEIPDALMQEIGQKYTTCLCISCLEILKQEQKGINKQSC